LQGKGDDTVEEGLAVERAIGQLTISGLCVSAIVPSSDDLDNTAEQLAKLARQLRACTGEDCQRERIAAELTPIVERLR
jgi:hypothetical protein